MTQNQLYKLKKSLGSAKSGESLFGKDGAFTPMFKGFIEAAPEVEMKAHLDSKQRKGGDKCYGKGSKSIKTR